jgi:uncharacterized lipoprotein YajG
MKNHMIRIVFGCALALFLAGCASTPAPSMDAAWHQVTVTRNADDVKGMTRVGDVSASSQMFFGSPASLRKQATEKIQQEAASKGATVVLI